MTPTYYYYYMHTSSGKKALRPYVHELTFIAIFEECTYTTSRSEDDTMYTTMIWSYTALDLALNHLCILTYLLSPPNHRL